MKIRSSTWATALSLSATTVYGSAQRHCPNSANGICYRIGVSAGSSSIYLQITAPTSYQWVALGTGTSMFGSDMVVIYQDGLGNLTLSPRQSTSHATPQQDVRSSAASLILLSGSGLSHDGSMMTANIACDNCISWGSGTLKFNDTMSSWIGAWKSGSSLATDNKNARISMHEGVTGFHIDLTVAVISDESDPFDTIPSSTSNGTATYNTSSSGSQTTAANQDNTIDNTEFEDRNYTLVLTAHGVISGLVMVVLYPFVSMLMPLLGRWSIHAGLQMVNFLLMWTGIGLGIQKAILEGMLFNNTHTILGTVVVILFSLQPILGFLHHRHFVRTHQRGIFSHLHIWYGRMLLAAGAATGATGLQLSGASTSILVGYTTVVIVIALLYTISKLLVFRSQRLSISTNRQSIYTSRESIYKEGSFREVRILEERSSREYFRDASVIHIAPRALM